MIVAAMTFVIGMLFIRETKDVDIYAKDQIMWKYIVAFVLFAALGLWLLMKGGGDIDLGGEARSAGHPVGRKGTQVSSGVRTVKKKAGISGLFAPVATRYGGRWRNALRQLARATSKRKRTPMSSITSRDQIPIAC